MNLPVNEIFNSIQGEGSFTGTPAVFVRLQFCGVGCSFCDTKHTWAKDDSKKITFDEMLRKWEDGDEWADVSITDLYAYLVKQPESLIVITGGEPCMYDLTEFTENLLGAGKTVQIETSGTAKIKVSGAAFVTLSPKIGMPGGLKVLPLSSYRADEIKMPVGKQKDVDILKEFLQGDGIGARGKPVYLQPLSQNEKATELCIEQARQNGWRLSAQLHKYLKVR